MQETGLEAYSIKKHNRTLRMGYTTGTCAAAATKAAVGMLLGQERIEEVDLLTPKGILLHLKIQDIHREDSFVSCSVEKDAGDDPDTTNKIRIYSRAEKTETGEIQITGGPGVGIVTLPGLSQKVGEYAINPIPRKMIFQAAREMSDDLDYEGGLQITIFVPEGEEIAKKTFNSRLGIEGGISILGTTGIVEPMSERAYLESLRIEMNQQIIRGEEYLIMTPGNYGVQYLRSQGDLPIERVIKCGNYVGEAIDLAVELGAKGILFVSHIGKFVKVAGGIMNTHSHNADCRMEILSAGVIRCGGTLECARAILNCNTTDEALTVLEREHLLESVMQELLQKIQYYLNQRSYEQLILGAVLFSNVHGFLGQSQDVQKLIARISKEL